MFLGCGRLAVLVNSALDELGVSLERFIGVLFGLRDRGILSLGIVTYQVEELCPPLPGGIPPQRGGSLASDLRVRERFI